MCQQPLTHNRAADIPKHQQPQKTATPAPEPPAKHPPTPQCVSSHSHITAKTTIKNTSHPYKTAMCNQPLTHSRAAEALNTVHPQDYDVAVQEAQPKPKAKSQAPQQD